MYRFASGFRQLIYKLIIWSIDQGTSKVKTFKSTWGSSFIVFPKVRPRARTNWKDNQGSLCLRLYSAALPPTSARRKHVNLLQALGHPSINIFDRKVRTVYPSWHICPCDLHLLRKKVSKANMCPLSGTIILKRQKKKHSFMFWTDPWWQTP